MGKESDRRRTIAFTVTERQLLDKIPHIYKDSAMPPGTKKVIRPSSAAAKIQTHPNYATSLFDSNSRPSTAAPGLSRPKTQAGGARQWARTPQPKVEEVPKPHRRLTVGAVDGLADTDAAQRTAVGHPQLGALFKGKIISPPKTKGLTG